MSSSGFSLGDGVCGITGKRVGRGIILNNIISATATGNLGPQEVTPTPGESKLHTTSLPAGPAALSSAHSSSSTSSPSDDVAPYYRDVPIRPIHTEVSLRGDVKYNVHHVKDYQQLKTVLGISANISGEIGVIGTASADMNYARTLTITREDVTLLLIGEYVSHEEGLPKSPDLTFDGKELASLGSNAATFKNGNGSHYVSGLTCGAKFLARIHAAHLSKEQGDELKANIEAKLSDLGIKLQNAKVGGGVHGNYNRNELFERIELTAEANHVGVPEIGILRPTGDLEKVYAYVESFDLAIKKRLGDNVAKPYLSPYPIGQAIEPYASLIKSTEASTLKDNVELSQKILLRFDALSNRVKYIIPTAERIVEQANRYPESRDNKSQLQRLNNIYEDAKLFERDIATVMLKIMDAQTDLTAIPEQVLDHFTLDKSAMARPLKEARDRYVSSLKNEEARKKYEDQLAELQTRYRYDIYSNLLELLNFIESAITDLEKDFTNAVGTLETEVAEIAFDAAYFSKLLHSKNDHHIHIKVPASNAALHWRLFDLETGKPLENVQFSVEVCRQNRFGHDLRYIKDPLLTNIEDDAIVEVGRLHPEDRYKIMHPRDAAHHPYTKPYKVAISLMGPLALNVRNGYALEKVLPQPPEPRQRPWVQAGGKVGLYPSEQFVAATGKPDESPETAATEVKWEAPQPDSATPAAHKPSRKREACLPEGFTQGIEHARQDVMAQKALPLNSSAPSSSSSTASSNRLFSATRTATPPPSGTRTPPRSQTPPP